MAESRSWNDELPADALAIIVNDCGLGQSDVAAVRLTSRVWQRTVDAHLKFLAPACTSLEHVASVATRFPFLRCCDLTRCDTRLVGHAALCRDASARLDRLLVALSRMPSLTALHISDTFSERMGQKHWAALVCAQAAGADWPEPRGPSDSGNTILSGGGGGGGGNAGAASATVSAAGGGAAAAAGAGAAAASAASTASTSSGGSKSAGQTPQKPGEEQSPDAGEPYRASTPCTDSGAEADGGKELAGLSAPTQGVCRTALAEEDGEQEAADYADSATAALSEGQAAETAPPSAAVAGPSSPAAAVACASSHAMSPVLSEGKLADPGIASFVRAVSRAGATHQRAFWLPDWCGSLAGLQELHVRGRQRPSSGLPPCLLWLHAGRTAGQLASLSLVRLSLATLPDQLQHLHSLTKLVAQDCSLSLVQRGLASGLSRLAHLDLSCNCLTQLPPDFTALTALQHLDLQRNKLAALPADMAPLSSLTCLLLNNNQLRQLPNSLSSLRALEHLSCSYNWLGGMGPSLPLLCGLPRLRRLELACVSDVRCRLVPPQELRCLATQLTHLDLAANNLVPADVLGTLTALRTLVLADCGLLAVPPWVRRLGCCSLARLDLSSNSLAEIPPWLAACSRLRHLNLAHNRLSIRVPPGVMEQLPRLVVVEAG